MLKKLIEKRVIVEKIAHRRTSESTLPYTGTRGWGGGEAVLVWASFWVYNILKYLQNLQVRLKFSLYPSSSRLCRSLWDMQPRFQGALLPPPLWPIDCGIWRCWWRRHLKWPLSSPPSHWPPFWFNLTLSFKKNAFSLLEVCCNWKLYCLAFL